MKLINASSREKGFAAFIAKLNFKYIILIFYLY